MAGNESVGGKSETGNRHPFRNAGFIPIGHGDSMREMERPPKRAMYITI